jgi:hypothetical protein
MNIQTLKRHGYRRQSFVLDQTICLVEAVNTGRYYSLAYKTIRIRKPSTRSRA